MTTTATSPKTKKQQRFDQHDAFVAYILNLCAASTKARADLRTGLGRPLERCTYIHRYLVPRLAQQNHPERHDDGRRAHYAVASLIAARPRAARDAAKAAATAQDGAAAPAAQWWARPNLAASLAEAVNKKLFKPDTTEADLHLMARQSSDLLLPRLPSLTHRLLEGGVAVDWSVLLEDLSGWNRDHDKTATRWLESYFRVRMFEERKDELKENH